MTNKICKTKNEHNVDENVIAPDGGWGWLVCTAGGLSLLLTYNIRKTFGLIFRENFEKLGITSSQITTIYNFHIAIAHFQGFLYGPVYRYLSIRQVALASASTIVFGIFLLAFVKTFTGFIISFSIIYGIGTGFLKSATFLCINTYFQNLRRRAYSLTMTLSAIGPMIMPIIVNILLYNYDVQGTLVIFSSIAMHSIAFALIYQPVKWHLKKIPVNKNYVINLNYHITPESTATSQNTLNTIILDNDNGKYTDQNQNLNSYCIHKKVLMNHNEKDHVNICCSQKIDTKNNNNELNYSECNQCKINLKEIDLELKSNEINPPELNKLKYGSYNFKPEFKSDQMNCPKIKEISITDVETVKNHQNTNCFKNFNFELLSDLSYLNIIFGFAFASVFDTNFNLLTPFFLADFGLTNNEIALVMSIVAFTDIIVRFLLPYITIKIKWNSRIFYLIGISGTTLSRLAIAQNPSFHVHLILFSCMGAFAATVSIFRNLVLPEYIPMEKLPSAIGLQQIPTGLFAVILGPVVGLIRDATNYKFLINILSLFSLLTMTLWTVELVWKQIKIKIYKLK